MAWILVHVQAVIFIESYFLLGFWLDRGVVLIRYQLVILVPHDKL